MAKRRIILVASFLVFFQCIAYIIYSQYKIPPLDVHLTKNFGNEKYNPEVEAKNVTNQKVLLNSQPQSKKDVQVRGPKAPDSIPITNVNMTVLVEQVSSMLKDRLEQNTTSTKHVVKIRCVPNPTWNYACVDKNCTQLSTNLEERVKSLYSEKTVLTKTQDDLLRSIAEQIPMNDVILLTAASSNHFEEMQALLHSVHSQVFPELAKRENFSFVLWDIGLSAEERRQTEKCCRCQVISFPFDKFHVAMRDLHCYMWKPLVIRMTQLRSRKFAVWQDTSIRYLRYPGLVFDKGVENGLQLLRQKGGTSLPHRTLPEMFAYFGQRVCSFYQFPEIASGFGVYKNDPFVLTAVTNPWARCGFEKSCMCPKDSGRSHRGYFGPRHRFDQSALSIITDTLYSSEVYRILLFQEEMKDFFWVGRSNKLGNYFNSTGCLSN